MGQGRRVGGSGSADLTVCEGSIPMFLDEWTFVILPLLLGAAELMIHNSFTIKYVEFILMYFTYIISKYISPSNR